MENADKEIGIQESEKQNDLHGSSVPTDTSQEQVTPPEVKAQEESLAETLVGRSNNFLEQDRVLVAIESLTNNFQVLQQGFDSKIKYDTSKENIIDSLHRELQTYREGLHFQILRPIFSDLISMYDDLSNLLKFNMSVEGESETVVKLRQSLASFQDTIESTLESHGVTVIAVVGDQFIPQKQRVVRTEVTDNPQKDRLICERVRKGFEYEGKVLRPETVVLYKFIGNATPPEKLS